MEFEQYGGYAKFRVRDFGCVECLGRCESDSFDTSNPGEISNPLLDNDQRITRGMTSFALANHYAKTSGTLSFFYNLGKHWINDGYHLGVILLIIGFIHGTRCWVSLSTRVYSFRGNHDRGFDYFHFGGEAWNKTLAGERDTQADKTQDDVAGYIDFRQNLGDWLPLLTWDPCRPSFASGDRVGSAGRVFFHLPENSEVKLMASKGFRYPTIREMYMFRPANPDLKPERLWSYELSFAQRLLDGRLSYGVNVFYIDGENLIMRMPIDGRP